MVNSLALSLILACSRGAPERSAEPEASVDEATQPDIVLVLVDTLRADHLGVYGYERPTSPHIDAWAQGASVFDRAYAHSGWTLASVASLFTGRLPHQHRTGHAPVADGLYCPLPDDVPTVAEQLRAAGYRTGAFINNTFLAPEFRLNRGFEHWDWVGSSNLEHRSAADTVAAALQWMGEAPDTPVYAVVHMMEPHAFYNPPEPFLGTFSDAHPLPEGQVIDRSTIVSWQTYEALPTPEQRDRLIALYDEEILTVDAAFQALLDGLEARPADRPTLVVFTADHGEEFWDHGGYEHGHTLMGELTRVPLIVKGPGFGAGRFSTVVSHTDLVRSIRRLAGVAAEPGGDLQGIAAAGSYAGPRLSVSENTLYGPPRVSIVDDGYRLDIRQDKQVVSLWKVAADASETQRVLGDQANALARPLFGQLIRIRGDAEPLASMTAAACSTEIPDPEVFSQLEALGYLDVRPEVPLDQAGGEPTGGGASAE
ncbi:MAG: hypothetical protein D6798_15910 [Deltaproteobacteria bacterium]|nr:MAG: hypothetical protein D6798_15910 [Deltaproteobacteria bacterium]